MALLTTSFTLNRWQWLFLLLWLHRYLRLIINTISHWRYRSIQIPSCPSYHSSDVTIIIPTIHYDFTELRSSLLSILACHPHELIIVTTNDKYAKLAAFVATLKYSNIRCYSTPIANKRVQLCAAIPHVTTPLTILADDDVTWPSTILPHLLAPFEDPSIGGVGPSQRVRRLRSGPLLPRVFNWLGAAYIQRRNFEISATHGIDGGTSCMSGRTCCFRRSILQSSAFMHGFTTERWGRFSLNADDDNFITRWLVNHGWKTWIQYGAEVEIETTLEDGPKFLYQCSRWARSNWRSNYTSLVTERVVWRQQPYSTYALHIATFTSLSFVFDPLVIWLCYQATSPPIPLQVRRTAIVSLLTFMLASKIVKLLSLFTKHPADVAFLPVSILFGYFHGCIKLYALCTLRITSWGSRTDGDTNDEHRMTSTTNLLPPRRRAGSLQNMRLRCEKHDNTTMPTTISMPSSFKAQKDRFRLEPLTSTLKGTSAAAISISTTRQRRRRRRSVPVPPISCCIDSFAECTRRKNSKEDREDDADSGYTSAVDSTNHKHTTVARHETSTTNWNDEGYYSRENSDGEGEGRS